MNKLSSKCKCFIYFLVLILVLSISNITMVFADTNLPRPSEQLYVTDKANIISSSVEEYIVENNDILYANTGAQIAVLTIDFLPSGYDAEEYAYAIFDSWGIGSKEKNNGILLLLVPGEDKYWLVQGSGLEKQLTSGTLDSILSNYLEADFFAENYDAAVKNTFQGLLTEMVNIYGASALVNNNSNTPNNDSFGGGSYTSNSFNVSGILSDYLLPLIIFLIICIIVTSNHNGPRNRRRRYYGPRPVRFGPSHRHIPPMGGGSRGFGGGFKGGGGPRSFGGGGSRGGGAGRK